MRVVYFLGQFPKLSETFVLDQIEGLLALGEDVRVVALGAGDTPRQRSIERLGLDGRTTYLPPVPPRLARALGAPRMLARLAGRSKRAALGALRVDRYGRLASSLELLVRAAGVGDALAGDVVHCHFGTIGRLAVILRELGTFDAPVLTTFHGHDLRLGAARGAAVFEPLQRRGDAVIAISRWSRARLRELGFDDSRLIEHPVGTQLASVPRRERDEHAPLPLLTVARLVEEKALDVGVDAFALLARERPALRWRWRIVGGGPLERPLRERIVARGLGDRIELVGAADREAVRAELGRAALFVLPSRAEVLPVSLMEAHAAGLPVVATRVGAVDEIVADGTSGLLVPPDDAPALAAALAQLLDDAPRREAFGAAGRAHVAARYEIGALNRRLRTLLRELAARGRRSDATGGEQQP